MTAVDSRRRYGFYSTAPKRVVDLGPSVDDYEPPAPADFHTAGSGPKLVPGDRRHGTENGYKNHGCRCDDCKTAARVALRERKAANRTRPIPDHVHGTDNGYCNYFCKCPDCRAAHHASWKRRYGPSPRRGLERAKTEAMYADYQTGLTVEQIAAKWGLSPGSIRSRFHRAGLKRRDLSGASTAMYMDYCTGMTVGEVATKWGVSSAVVSNRFGRMGFARRPRTGGVVQPNAVRVRGISFEEANSVRASLAGKRRAESAHAALPLTVAGKHRQVLELRIADPNATLTELGARCSPPMSKDAYASHLRRALTKAGVTS